MKLAQLGLVVALAVALGEAAKAQIAILQIQTIDGEGAVHAPGSHASRFLTVEITDETGRPVPGAAVSFHLPEDGAGGTFPNGLRTDIAVSDGNGRATLHNLTLNRVPGRFQIRITAAKEQARAGIVSFQYVAESSSPAARHAVAAAQIHRARWILIAAALGGGTAAGVLARRPAGPSATAPTTTVSTSTVAPPPSIGTPTITVGAP